MHSGSNGGAYPTFFQHVGLTRVANITGLDHLGIPTVVAIRPASSTMVTASGKGLTLAAAMASGVMEAMEIWHAENADLNEIRATYAEVRSEISK